MALKKPSDFFGNNKTPLDEVKESYDSARPEKIEKVSEAFDAFKSNLNHIQSLSDFTSTFDSFKNNLEKVESVSSEVSEIREEIKTLIKKEDLDSAMMAQLLFVEESITNIESKISSINGKTVDSIKEDFANLSDTINGFLSVDVPKYKKLIAESEVKTDSRFATFKEGIEENLDKIKVDVNKEVETALESIESINENTINIVKAEVKETVGDVNKKVNELVEKELPKYKKLFAETEVKTEEKINSAIHSYKSTIESLSERVKEFTEEEIPKYSNLLIETKLKSEKEVKKLEEEVLSRVKTLSEKVESLSEDVEQKTFERVESLQDVVKEYKEEIESISKRYETLQKDFTGRVVHEDKKLSQYSKKLDEFSKRFSFIEETLTEDVRELKENLETNTSKFYTELKSEIDNVEQNIAQTVKDLEVNIVINETHLKKQNEYIGNIQEEVKEVLDKLQLDVLEKKNAQLVERINHVEEVFSKINEKTLLTEDNPTLPGDPSTNNSGDPLTPLDQKFVTLDQLQNHYRIFINRIQQQIATIGGGGEVRLEFLDDVDRDSVKVDGKFLKYQASSGKFIGADASGDVGAGGTWATFDSNTGITTTKKVKIDNDLEVTGVTTSTGGFVGNVTGTATGLSGTPDISIRNITGVAATFTGVLTYEDVTNIDSLGLGTFRNGLIVQGTGTTSTTLNVSGVSTFTGTTNHTHANISRSHDGIALQLINTSTSNSAYVDQRFVIDGHSRVGLRGQIHGANLGGQLRFYTAADTQVLTERAVIDHQGRFGINVTSPTKTLDVGGNSQFDGDVTVLGTIATEKFNVSGVSTFAGVEVPDDAKKILLGTGKEMQVFHDGTNSTIKDTRNSGKVRIQADNFDVIDKDASITMLSATSTGVSLLGDVSIADKIVHTGDTDTAIRFPADDTFTVETAGSEILRITPDGSVGIGTTSAEHKVAIFNDEYSGVTIKSNRATATSNLGGLDFKTQNTAVARIQSLVDGSIKFRNSSSLTERLRIDSGGDIFINRTSQLTDAKLSVQADSGEALIAGQMNANTGTSTILQTYVASGQVSSNISVDNANKSLILKGATTEGLRINSGGDIFINLTSQLIDAKLTVQADSGEALIAGQMNANTGTSTVLQTFNSSGLVSSNISVDNANRSLILKGATTEGLRIDSNGDVGVGIDDPQERLHVARTVMVTGNTPQIRLNANDSDADDDDRTMLGQATSAGNFVTTAVDNDTILRGTATGNLLFGVGTAEKLRITSAGNIGIGENSPSAILHVTKAGDPNIIQENSGNDSLDRNNTYSFQFSDGEGAFVKATRPSSGSASDTHLAFGSGGSTERVRIDSSGRLLIGTTTEGAALADNLTVADSADCGITIRSGTSNYGSIYFSDATSGADEYKGQIEYNHNTDILRIYSGGTAVLRIDPGKLDVTGHTETDTLNVSGISTFANTVSVAETIEHTGDTNTSISFPSNDYIRLTTSGSSRLNATPNGYILIGTNSEPSGGDAHAENARLLVQGRIGNTADSGRLNLQRGSSASNGSSIGSITFTDNSNNAYARIETQADATPGTDDYPGRIVFSTTPDGSASPTESLHINSSGQTNIGGSAGAVGSKFNIFNGSDTENILGITGADESSEYAAIGVNGGNAVITGGGAGSTNTGILFRTAASGTETERLRITSSGNVGINSTVPSEELDVGGTTQTQILKVNGSSTFNGNINMFSTAPQLIMKEDGSSHGDTNWALVRDADSFSIRWNNASPYALRASTSGGSVTSVFLRQSGLEVNASGTVIQGSLSKGSGSFKIDHPLVGMSTTHNLVHSFIEGPQADLIYRGKVDLVDGSATVNIDTAGRMTEGTFVALCTNVQCFTTNETDWTAIKGSVSGNTLTVLAQDSSCTATVSWMVVGERKDQHMIDTNWTDDNGRVITEPPKTD